MAQPPVDGVVAGFVAADGELPACRDPRQAFQLLCDSGDHSAGASRGIALGGWLRLSPTMGLADLVTADSTFEQLSSSSSAESSGGGPAAGQQEQPTIAFETFEKYVNRIAEKASPGSNSVGGWIDQASADSVLATSGVELAEGECVVMAGGAPSYAIHDMITTPRTAGCLILTTHALYWRTSGLRKMLQQARIRRFELLPQGEVPAWVAEEYRYGPMGLGLTDMALRLSRQRGGARPAASDGSTASEHEAIFNFPLHAGHRSLFVHAITEVVRETRPVVASFSCFHNLDHLPRQAPDKNWRKNWRFCRSPLMPFPPSASAPRRVCLALQSPKVRNGLFSQGIPSDNKTPIICQDRLGTNARKLEKRTVSHRHAREHRPFPRRAGPDHSCGVTTQATASAPLHPGHG